CTDQRGFDRGRAGLARAEQCAAEDYASAWRLGESLRTLAAERDALAAGQAGRDPAARNAAARRIRQLEVDIEAIRGLLQLRRIVEQGPVPESGAPAGTALRDATEAAQERPATGHEPTLDAQGG